MRKLSLLLMLMLFSAAQLFAQRIITGTVTGDDGQTLPSATVVVNGDTKQAAQTDIDGKYSIKIPANGKFLRFSFVGMKSQDVSITASNVINVTLSSESSQLEGIVVTALGISREKKSLAYAVSEVSGDQLNKGGSTNVASSLSGKVAGVEIKPSSGMPGAPAQVLIRGSRSFSGDNTPLYVVDGMPISSTSDYEQNVTGTFGSSRSSDIDPNDIASISVLKGQAAAALYGIKATNGVIIITTKSGKGLQKGKPVVSFSSNFTADIVARLPEVQQTYAQGSAGKFAAANSFSWGPKITDLSKNATYGGDANGKPGMFWDPYKAAWVTPTAYNNPKEFFKTPGTTVSNNISVSQATEWGDYMVGVGMTNQNGIIKNTGMDRYNAKISANTNLNKYWKSGFSANYSDMYLSKVPSGNSSWLFTVYGAPASFDLMGTPYHANAGDHPEDADYRQISYRRGAVGENPRWAVENNKLTEKTKRLFGNSYLEFKPVEWFKAKYQLGIDMYNTINRDYYEMGSAANGQALLKAGEYTTPAKPEYSYVKPEGGSLSDYGIERRTINSLLNLSFKKKLGESLTGLLDVGNDVTETNSKWYRIDGTSFAIPNWNNIANTSKQNGYEGKGRTRNVGFYGNLSLDYLSMLYFNATGRYDIVSTMPRGSRGFFYPSVSLGFVFTELGSLKDNKTLSYGKLRVSYAQVGQAGLYRPFIYPVYGAGDGFTSDGIAFPLGGVTGYATPNTLYDPALKPQNTSTIEAGIELKFFNNRLGLDYAYSNQNVKDQIFPVPLAPSSGHGEVYMNAGKMNITGHEVTLTATPVQTKDFSWFTSIMFTQYTNMCKELAPGVTSITLGGYTDPNIRASAGDTYPVIYGTMYKRDKQGRILVDEDPKSDYYGMPMGGEFGKIGEVSPKFMLNLNNTLTYKFINLSFQVDWKNGGQMYSGSNRLMDYYGSSKKTEDRTTPFIYDGYKADGTKNDIQRGGAQDPNGYQLFYDQLSNIPEAAIYETSFVKLREVSLGISLPKKWVTPLKLQSLSVDFMARNFLLWTTLPNFDPEASQGQGNMQGGMDYMSLPQATSYGIGLNITF